MLGGIVHVLVADGLVDHLADAFGACFGCKGRAAASLKGRNFLGERFTESIHADTRKAHVNGVEERVVDDGIGEAFHRLVVGGGERKKSELAFAGRLDACLRDIQNVIGVELAARPVPNACLTETTTLGATAHDFDTEAVMHQLHVRNQVLDGVVLRIHHRDKLTAHAVGVLVAALGGFSRNDVAKFVGDHGT